MRDLTTEDSVMLPTRTKSAIAALMFPVRSSDAVGPRTVPPTAYVLVRMTSILEEQQLIPDETESRAR